MERDARGVKASGLTAAEEGDVLAPSACRRRLAGPTSSCDGRAAMVRFWTGVLVATLALVLLVDLAVAQVPATAADPSITGWPDARDNPANHVDDVIAFT